MKGYKIKNRFSILSTVLFVVLIAYSVSLIFPVLWGLMMSFKDVNMDYAFDQIGFPVKWVLTNYENAFKNLIYPVINETSKTLVNLWGLALNSIIYSLGCALINTFVPFLVAYLTARFRYKFSRIVNIIVIVVMIIPIVGALPSEIQIAQTLGIYDKMWGIFIMQGNFLGMYYLVFYEAFRSVPNDFAEAAEIDGASNVTIMFRIIMPMLKTTFIAVLLLRFIFYWNEYQIALIYLPSSPTISVALVRVKLMSQSGMADPPGRLACSMILCVPILIVFLMFKEKIMGNVSLGGIKG